VSATSNAPPESRSDLLRQIAEATPPRWWEIYDRHIRQPGEYFARGISTAKIAILSFVLSVMSASAWCGLFQSDPDLRKACMGWLTIVLIGAIWAGIDDRNRLSTVIAHVVRALIPGSRFIGLLMEFVVDPLERRGHWRSRWHLEELHRRLRALEPPSASGSTSGI
jgi:hypothetical protein